MLDLIGWYDWGHDRNGFKQCNGTPMMSIIRTCLFLVFFGGYEGGCVWWFIYIFSDSHTTGTSPQNAEYVPMIWGKWALANATALTADLKKNAPGARYLFGASK